MKYSQKNDGIIVSGLKSFSLSETFDCGQCFRAFMLNENEYYTIAHGKILTIAQIGDGFYFSPTTIDEFERVWVPYFDISRNYCAIKESLAANDLVMRDAVEYAPGIRILKQDFFECLISYIISQNNRIPMIKQVIKSISEAFGKPVGEINGEMQYSFPSLEDLSRASPHELRICKTGFRDKYIADACLKLNQGDVNPYEFENMGIPEIRESLMKIKGVGVKVADCVILFSLGRYGCFPTDVWIKRVMEHFYFKGQAAHINDIHKMASEKFGAYAGFAQEYLFYYARQFKIGTKQKD